MPKLIIFEDDPSERAEIHGEVDGAHQVVAEAETLSEAFRVIGNIAVEALSADVLLLDGNLRPENPPAIFRRSDYLPPVENSSRRFFRRRAAEQTEFFRSDYDSFFDDASIIIDVLRSCGIEIPIIGISSLPMKTLGINVDLEIPKRHFRALNGAIAKLLQ